MFGFGGAAMPRSAALQTRDQIVVQIAHVKVPSHLGFLYDTIAINDSIRV